MIPLFVFPPRGGLCPYYSTPKKCRRLTKSVFAKGLCTIRRNSSAYCPQAMRFFLKKRWFIRWTFRFFSFFSWNFPESCRAIECLLPPIFPVFPMVSVAGFSNRFPCIKTLFSIIFQLISLFFRRIMEKEEHPTLRSNMNKTPFFVHIRTNKRVQKK